MANYKQTELKSTEEVNLKMRRSFSWDRAFFTSDGFLDPEELSSMIEGSKNEFNYKLQKIEELENLEAKMFQEIDASTKKFIKSNSTINLSSEKQPKKVTGAGGAHKDAPVKTPPTRSSPLAVGGSGGGSGGSPGNNVKTLARKTTSSKNGKANADSPSKTPPAITTKSKVGLVNTRVSKTSPASPVSPLSSGSKNGKANVNSPLKTPSVNTRVSPVSPKSSNSSPSSFAITQQSKRKPTDARRNDEWKSSKSAVDLMSKTQSSISLKIKPPPVNSNPSSPSGSTSSSIDQKSKSRGIKSVHQTAKLTSKKHPTNQTSDSNGKQPVTISRTGSTNGSNARKLSSTKTIAADNKGSKPNSTKTTTKKKSKGKENIIIISPEILDLKGKINALKMEINIQKDRCSKLVRA